MRRELIGTRDIETGGLRRLVSFTRFVFSRSGRSFALASVFLLLGSLSEGVSIVLLIPMLSLLRRNSSTITLPMHAWPFLPAPDGRITIGLGVVLAAFVIIIGLRAILMGLKDIYNSQVTYDFLSKLQKGAFESIVRTKWSALSTMRSTDLNHVLTADSGRVHVALVSLLGLIQALVMTMVYFLISLAISPAMTAVAGGIGIVLATALAPVRRLAQRHGHALTDLGRNQYRIVGDLLSGMKTTKALCAEQSYLSAFRAVIDTTNAAIMHYLSLRIRGTIVFQMTSAGALALFVYVSIFYFHLELPAIVALLFLLMRLSPRFMSLQTSIQDVLTNLPALDAMRDSKLFCDANAEPPYIMPVDRLARGIAFRDLSFVADPGGAPILDRLTFDIPAGAITAIIGPTGSGKTTLADIVLGLIQPTAGRMEIDGVLLHDEQLRSWRGQIGYVAQETFLLNDTVEANLRLADRDVTEKEIWEALEIANAREFIEERPRGLQSLVGDGGMQLSGGERQRIALARALLKRPSLLILDEATSALDHHSQKAIADAVKRLRGTMTILTIAHRRGMIAAADYIVAIDRGRLIENGPAVQLSTRASGYLQAVLSREVD